MIMKKCKTLINLTKLINNINFNQLTIFNKRKINTISQSDFNQSPPSSSPINDESSSSSRPSEEKNRKIHPFNILYPWNSLTEFVDILEKRIVYNDKKLIAINKPYGVAYHKPNKTLYKPYSFESLSLIPGEPKFCLGQALSMLEERLEVEKLSFIKTIDRYSSGIILLSGDDKSKEVIKKSLRTNKSEGQMFYNYACIAQGFPAIDGNELSEKVRIKLKDLDELADYREPFISDAVYRKQDIDNGYLARVCLKINSVNRLNSSSYLQVSTNQMRWNFVRCYVAAKAAFIIGDLRFSSNVKRILGEQVLETTNSFYKNNRIEPLTKETRYALKVQTNRKVPIMLHLESIKLRNYYGKDLTIECPLPEHFQFALKRLKLTKSMTNQSSNQQTQSNQLDKSYF